VSEQQGIYGIDLGTTYSVVAYIDETGRPAVVRNAEGDDTTPSMVYFESANNTVVGKTAKEAAGFRPDDVVSLIKREMGNKDYSRTFYGRELSPSGISGIILAALAKSAEEETRRPVRQAVITVPAYFGLLEKDATRKAGEIAGLEVIGIVPEPVAAALAYGVAGSADGTTFLVYDLGGATFDLTLIKMTDTSVEVLAVDGAHRLGGADWDARLFEYLKEQTIEQAGDDSIEDDEASLQELRRLAEETKKALTRAESKKVNHRLVGGMATSIAVTRAQFEEMTSDLLEETIRITHRMLDDAEERFPGARGQISAFLLVGGSSKMPAVAEQVRREFPWAEPRMADPDLAVAKGAALYAAGQTVRVGGSPSNATTFTARSQPGGRLPAAVSAEDIAAVAACTGLDAEQLQSIGSYAIETAVLSSALVPFIQALATKAANDVYEILRRLIPGRRSRLGRSSLNEKSEAIIADKYAKVALRLPPALDEKMQASLHRLLVGLTSQPAQSEEQWLQISRVSGEAGWKVDLITEAPAGSVLMDGVPAANDSHTYPLADGLEVNRIKQEQRISSLEEERKLLRSMVKYLAAELDLKE
jgi:molecular chaperone DnaK